MCIAADALEMWRPIELICVPDRDHGWKRPTLSAWILREHETLTNAFEVERARLA